jgi:hypothetical protein
VQQKCTGNSSDEQLLLLLPMMLLLQRASHISHPTPVVAAY